MAVPEDLDAVDWELTSFRKLELKEEAPGSLLFRFKAGSPNLEAILRKNRRLLLSLFCPFEGGCRQPFNFCGQGLRDSVSVCFEGPVIGG